MSRLFKQWIPILVAAVTGLIVLAGYLVPSPALANCRDRLVEWAVILAGFAFVLGLLNVIRVHGSRVVQLHEGWPYSLILLLTALVTWIPPALFGPAGKPTQQLLSHIIGPLGASLAALLVLTLTMAAFRLLRVRRSGGAVLFVLVVAVALLGNAPFTGLEWLGTIRDWVINVPGMAGTRGLLLGVGLGTVITALRILLASDRPYSEF